MLRDRAALNWKCVVDRVHAWYEVGIEDLLQGATRACMSSRSPQLPPAAAQAARADAPAVRRAPLPSNRAAVRGSLGAEGH